MWDFILKQYKKWEEMISYLFFGFLAFLFYMFVYWAAAAMLGADNDKPVLVSAASVIAWVLTVFFAYWTNHTFVFKSKAAGMGALIKELIGFFGARVITLLLDILLTMILMDALKIDHIITKMITQIMVTVCNYVFSKLFIFKRTDGHAVHDRKDGSKDDRKKTGKL